MRPGVLLVVSGPSGVGKTTVLRALAARRPFHFSVSVTTRSPRPGEVDGVDYHFIGDEEFDRLIAGGDLLEWAPYSGHRYGTPREPVFSALAEGFDVVCDIELQGAMQVKAAVPGAVTIFIMPPSIEELERRLLARRDTTAAEASIRLALARSQMELADQVFDHVVVNDEVAAAVSRIERILDAA